MTSIAVGFGCAAVFLAFVGLLRWWDRKPYRLPDPEPVTYTTVRTEMLEALWQHGMYYAAFDAGEVRIMRQGPPSKPVWVVKCGGRSKYCDTPGQAADFFCEWWYESQGGIGPARARARRHPGGMV